MKFSFFICLFSLSALASNPVKVRIGWQVPWAIQGQLVAIFMKTDILQKNHIDANYIGKTYGPELNELALANEVDVILTADQPAAVLFSKDKGWFGISRLMYNRTSTYVPMHSEIKSLRDLKGKTVGVPFGAAAQRVLYKALEDLKISPQKDTHMTNLGMLEQDALIKKSSLDVKKWDQFDALSGFDPLPAKFEVLKQAKMIHDGKVVALVVASDSFLKKNPDFAKNFNKSLIEAYEFYRNNLSKANNWYVEVSKLTYLNDAIFQIASKYEPNLVLTNPIRISFDDADYKLMDEASSFVEKNVGKKVYMKKFVFNKDIPKTIPAKK